MTYLSQQKRYLVIYIEPENVLHDNKIKFMAVCTIRFFPAKQSLKCVEQWRNSIEILNHFTTEWL